MNFDAIFYQTDVNFWRLLQKKINTYDIEEEQIVKEEMQLLFSFDVLLKKEGPWGPERQFFTRVTDLRCSFAKEKEKAK